MTRADLLKSRNYVTAGIQLQLLNMMEDYMKEHKLSRKELSDQLKVSKGYISQILNVNYDHKISKVVDLALSLNKMPVINFVDLDKFISEDADDKTFELFPVMRPRSVTFETKAFISGLNQNAVFVDEDENTKKRNTIQAASVSTPSLLCMA